VGEEVKEGEAVAQAVREVRELGEPLRVVLTLGEGECEGVSEADTETLGEGVEEADTRTLPEASAERVRSALAVGASEGDTEGLPLSEGDSEALSEALGEPV
jgi:hypothetical protein